MRYSIRSDIAGRIRLRCDTGALATDEARGIELALMSIAGVTHAEVHAANASILVLHEPAARAAVLEAVDALELTRLPRSNVADLDAGSLALAAEDNRFVVEVGTLVGWRLLRRMLLPLPLRTAYIVWQSLAFMGDGLRHLLQGQLSVEVLDATAIGASLLRGTFSEADTIMFLLQLSDAMERHVSSRTRLALEQGLIARDQRVTLVVDGQERTVPATSVQVGDLVRVRAGMAMPVDGTVEHGEGEANEASMTGEALLVHKEAGSSVFAGTALEDGDLTVRCTAPPGRTRVDAIAQLVERSSSLKAAIASRAERLADSLVPAAFASFVGILAVTRSVEKALAVLMVDYSCAIKVSTPIAVMSAMREAAAQGVVIKGGRYLEALADADTVVFDKTGTLTEASPELVAVVSAGNTSKDDILRLAACIEEHYPHAVANAIVEGARLRGLAHDRELHAEVRYIVAHGIAADVDGQRAVIGSAHFVFEDEGVPLPDGFAERIEAAAPGTGTVFLARGGKLLGALCVSDPLRGNARAVLQELHACGIERCVMLTGDAEPAAARVAAELGIDAYHAQVPPEGKAHYVEHLKAEGHHVVMVGDGINDSPALAAANVSVALSDASDIARAVADVSIREADLTLLVTARQLSQLLMRRIASRYRLIIGFNSALIVLGVASVLPLTTAATLHNLSTVAIAASNATPLLRKASA